MIPLWLAILIALAAASFGLLIGGMLCAAGRADEAAERARERGPLEMEIEFEAGESAPAGKE